MSLSLVGKVKQFKRKDLFLSQFQSSVGLALLLLTSGNANTFMVVGNMEWNKDARFMRAGKQTGRRGQDKIQISKATHLLEAAK